MRAEEQKSELWSLPSPSLSDFDFSGFAEISNDVEDDFIL
jgi:hypothetical protein